MDYHSQSAKEIITSLQTSVETGLSSAEAEKRFAKYGENKLKAKKKLTTMQRFLNQFKDVMILILLGAALVSFALACIEGKAREFIEPALILVIVILNAVMGVFQESKAEKALDALQQLSAPHARVRRDGHESIIDAALLVPGDIISLEAGDFVPADARIITAASLKSEESALTGESVPAEKVASDDISADASLGDRHNCVFSGCSIVYGRCLAVVAGTGMDTEMGKIANLLDNEADSQTPLQQKLATMGKYLGAAALIACAIIFIIGFINNQPIMELFMTAVSLAVSAIPEGLPAIVTIVLSIGVQKMVKNNAIIRKLPAVETLGSASVICSDKTGTLTQNRMTLVKAYLVESDKLEELTDEPASDDIKELLRLATLCCDGAVEISGDSVKHIGDPTETSIVYAALKNGLAKEAINSNCPRCAEIPFDSDRKLMTVVNKTTDGYITIVKGAFDVLCTRCTAGNIARAKAVTEEMSSNALRVIAVATKKLDTVPENPDCATLENDLTLIGLVGMIDPPREEAKVAVAKCKAAGIRPVMITGDHIVTATAIARQLGIMNDGDNAITGMELAKMSVSEFDSNVEKISVYARVSPEDKIRIVKAWQAKEKVVAMTGDGVNDAPALKAADIGCAMGITGTDVAKGAADMTLTDDNFATIVKAVEEGRGIYDNIKKAVAYLLGTNVAELLTVFTSMLVFKASPLLSMQLLWINLVTDSFPAIALGMEPIDANIMQQKPKPKGEGIFAGGMGINVVLQALMFSVLTLVAFVIGGGADEATITSGRTMAFLTLALLEIIHSFNMRSHRSLFSTGIFTNKKLNIACLASFILVDLIVFIPFLASAFGMTMLEPIQYAISIGLALIPVPIMELYKLIKRKS